MTGTNRWSPTGAWVRRGCFLLRCLLSCLPCWILVPLKPDLLSFFFYLFLYRIPKSKGNKPVLLVKKKKRKFYWLIRKLVHGSLRMFCNMLNQFIPFLLPTRPTNFLSFILILSLIVVSSPLIYNKGLRRKYLEFYIFIRGCFYIIKLINSTFSN